MSAPETVLTREEIRAVMEPPLRQGLTALGLPQEGTDALIRFAGDLLEVNQVMNLTAITDPKEVAALHFLDSAALLTLLDFRDKQVVDVGTGAGFPGLPLKILEPSVAMTLLDAQGKRVNFLQQVCDSLSLPGVECVHGRAEEFAPQHRESFDIAVSRAVANLRMLSELCLPLVKVGGYFLAMKSIDAQEETEQALSAIRTLGGTVERTADYQIPGTDVVHRAIIIRKAAPTPGKYPRAFAKIKKNPL